MISSEARDRRAELSAGALAVLFGSAGYLLDVPELAFLGLLLAAGALGMSIAAKI